MILTQRDVDIITSIQKWRFLLSRQIRVLCGFSGQRACDRRLKKLIEAGYIERRHYIYGIPRLYFVTRKAVKMQKNCTDRFLSPIVLKLLMSIFIIMLIKFMMQ